MPALLALLSSVLWGLSDFLGGAASRRLPVASVLGVSQLAGLLALTGLAAGTGALDTPRDYVLPGVAAGLFGVCALAMFFRALSIGTMGVVAPVAALGAGVPVVVGLVRGEQPSVLQVAGIVICLVGVVLASGPELSGAGSGGTQAVVLAVGAALGFGAVILFVADASSGPDSGAVVMSLVTMRLTSVVLLVLLLLATVRRRGWELDVRREDLPLLAFIGVTDAAANGCFAIASRSSLVSVAAVLASLYPVVTALLAYRVLGERLRPVQVVGVGVALLGVGLLAAG